LCLAAFALAGPLAPAGSRQNDRPLAPEEIRALVERTISNQHYNDAALAEYERRERRQLRKEEQDTRLSDDKTFRVVPTGTGTLRVLVEESGRPVPPENYRRQLRDVEKALVWALDPDERKQKQRVEKWNKRVRERAETVDAIWDAFLFTWQGRETLNGRAVVKLLLEPNPAYKPRSRSTDVFHHARATVWIDEAAAQLVRADAEVISDISIGGGILGKIYKGGRFVLEQAQVSNGAWLPTRYQYDFDGRKFFFSFEVHEVTLASVYRRMGPPKEALAAIRHELNNGVAPSASR
jgi:hypothetical protein